MAATEDRRDQLLRSARDAYHDLRLIERAMREDWPIRVGNKHAVAGDVLRFIQSYEREKKPLDENYFRAVNVMLRMTQQNLSQMDKRTRMIPKMLEMECLGVFGPPIPKGAEDSGASGGNNDSDNERLNVVPMGELVQQLALNDPDYLNYCRERASEEDCDSSDLCEPLEQRALEVCETPEAAG